MVQTCHNSLSPKASCPPTTKDTQQLCSYDIVLFLTFINSVKQMKKDVSSILFREGYLFIVFNLEI